MRHSDGMERRLHISAWQPYQSDSIRGPLCVMTKDVENGATSTMHPLWPRPVIHLVSHPCTVSTQALPVAVKRPS
jgi:hypothetical protein